ncbi:putative disease resistance RPP13-like protein 3 [Carex rostrata]
MEPYQLGLLNEKESLDLLLQKALPFQNPSEISSDLLEVGKSLPKKCNGLPLALIVAGGILSTKEPSYTAWERVLRTMDWHSNGNHCMDVVALNYEDMPHHLKTGFKYFASFPIDYEISAKQLI